VRVLPRVVLSGDSQTNSLSAPLTLLYTLGHHIPTGLTVWGKPVPYGGAVCVTPDDFVSQAVSQAQCYREICFGAECARLACVSANVAVGYQESNLQIYALSGGYTNTLLYDGAPLLATPHVDGLVPGGSRNLSFDFRFGSPLTDNVLERVYGGYPNDGRKFWPDWDCSEHNVTVMLQSQRTNTSRLQVCTVEG
jgi:hypothetical protein